MRSHCYQFSLRDLIRIVGPSLLVFLACVSVLQLARWADVLPSKPVFLHARDTVLTHQAVASRSRNPAQIVFTGDSTALAAVDAKALSRSLGVPAINLSLIASIDLPGYAQTASEFAAANPGQVRWVVLLVCPEKLSGAMENVGVQASWRELVKEFAPRPSCRGPVWDGADPFCRLLIRDRLANYLLPETLHQNGAAYFGFSCELDGFMTAHGGGTPDFGNYIPGAGVVHGWVLAPVSESPSRGFRAGLPAGVRLAIGLTPVARAAAPADAQRQFAECLGRWNDWMRADVVLTNLPAVLPSGCFTHTGHMNTNGMRCYSEMLARELSGLGK